MAQLICAPNLSAAWVDGLDAVLRTGGKDVHLVVQWRGAGEDSAVRRIIDRFIADRRREYLAQRRKACPAVWPVETVANTIFTEDLYLPALGDRAMEAFSEAYLEGRELARAAFPSGEYCERFVAWPGTDGPINQLTTLAGKLRRAARRSPSGKGALSSDYELAAAHPVDEFDLRVQAPGYNTSPYGFPCLSHVSVTIHSGALHLSAMYRNQHLVRRGYGNYLGITRLGVALAHEASLPLGEVMVIATHADAEVQSARGFGASALRSLVNEARTVANG